MTPRFTILLPVHRPPVLLPYAVESVRLQSQTDWELCIICDGVPDATVEAAKAWADRDPRITAWVFGKGERLGEAHRDLVLQKARGRFIAQIADDDLWLIHHLRELAQLLATVEFGNLTPIQVDPARPVNCSPFRLDSPEVRARMMESRFNFFGPSDAGYRLETYRRLPVGWSPAPLDIWTDLFMWRKFLALEPISIGSRLNVQTIHLPASRRNTASLAEREAESRTWMARIRQGLQFELSITDRGGMPEVVGGRAIYEAAQ